jgi:hypothetical protein
MNYLVRKSIVAAFVLFASHGLAAACSCARPGERSQMSFEGVVIKTEIIAGAPDLVRATVRVMRVHKGEPPPVFFFIPSAMTSFAVRASTF